MANFLEALITEWLEYQGYFVRRNEKVGKRPKGGWDGELDVVAFKPETKHFVHYECSTDAWNPDERETRFSRKLKLGRQYAANLPHLSQFRGWP